MPIQDRVHGADRGKMDIAVPAADLLAELRRPPARVLLPQPNNQSLDLEG